MIIDFPVFLLSLFHSVVHCNRLKSNRVNKRQFKTPTRLVVECES
jgi:hypothetical protein